MFLNINIERARDGLSVRQLAQKAGMKYDTLLRKLNGESEFTRAEMIKVQNAFSCRVSLDKLFETEDDPANKVG